MVQEIIENATVIVKSPGRINLIGEHLDYNGGKVMPAAIDLGVTLYFRETGTTQCRIYSKDYDDSFTFDLSNVKPSEKEWHNYFLGVVHFINQAKCESVKGFECVITSTLPIGSGVSSSAALECGVGKGLDHLFNIGLTSLQIITIARDAEHHFVGTKCGIMDQFAVVQGKENHLIQLSCDDLSFHYVPSDFGNFQIVLLNTNVSHNLATSEYNVRRAECEEGLKIIQKDHPAYQEIAHLPMSILSTYKDSMDPIIFKRLEYVIKENNRTQATADALANKDIKKVGALLYQSHDGLSKDYEVSCPELDFLVAFNHSFEGAIGARMMGGGFGGCTINLVEKEKVEAFIMNASTAYKNQFGISLSDFQVKIGDGVKVIN